MIVGKRVGSAAPLPFQPIEPGRRAGPSYFWRPVMTDWYARCAYDPEVKQRFHTAARARLRRLATTLHFPLGSFDLRSNLGGIAVSGEITLHHDTVYIQVCQPASGADSGILIRTCQSRRDYTGGRNHLAPLRLLDDAPDLAAQVRAVMATKTSPRSAAPSSRRAPARHR
jgi:hypothetical protein